MPASLTSNSGSWASFLSRPGLLPVARCDVSGTTVKSIAPIGPGRIGASLFVFYGVFNTAPLLLSQRTIVGSVFLPNIVSNIVLACLPVFCGALSAGCLFKIHLSSHVSYGWYGVIVYPSVNSLFTYLG